MATPSRRVAPVFLAERNPNALSADWGSFSHQEPATNIWPGDAVEPFLEAFRASETGVDCRG
jgi:hypothetical protein